MLAFDLTTHEGHFMGRSKNRLVLFEQDGQAYVRAAGRGIRCRGTSTRPTGAPGATPSTRSGARARDPDESMLHQIALRLGTAGP